VVPVDAVSVSSRCDPTPISLAGGVLSAAGAFNLTRLFLSIWSRLRGAVVPGGGINCASPTPMLRGTLGGVLIQLTFNFEVGHGAVQNSALGAVCSGGQL